jgi:hypothetical protein
MRGIKPFLGETACFKLCLFTASQEMKLLEALIFLYKTATFFHGLESIYVVPSLPADGQFKMQFLN